MAGLLVLAALHAVLALRTGCATYWLPVVIGWTGVLLVHRDRGLLRRRSSLASRIAGALLCLAGLGAAALWSGDYRAPLRFTALFAGGGTLLYLYGGSQLRSFGREGLMLALPLFTPVPRAIVAIAAPQRLTIAF